MAVEKKPVKIMETVLRDAHQSLIATRMTTEQMLPIIDKMDKVGYHAVECWGGATFGGPARQRIGLSPFFVRVRTARNSRILSFTFERP